MILYTMSREKVFTVTGRKEDSSSRINRIYKRTQGISTTEVMDKIVNIDEKERLDNNRNIYYMSISKFRAFTETKPPKPWGRVIYVSGAFDLLSFAHVQFLEKAKAQGDYLLVGLYTDADIKKEKGDRLPILDIYARSMGVLALGAVDDVVLNAPYKLNIEFIKEFGVTLVVESKLHYKDVKKKKIDHLEEVRGMVDIKVVDSGSKFGFDDLLGRIKKNSKKYKEILEQKKNKLKKYYEEQGNDVREV